MKKSSEHLEQCAFISWCRLNENIYPQLKWIFSIPNQGKRNITIGSRFKKEGLLAGVSDVMVPYPKKNSFGGLWIEFKHGNNKLTDSQKQFQEEMKKRGYKVSIVYSSEEAIETVKEYLNID